MNEDLAKPANPYPLSPALRLRDACRKTGHDHGGKRCPACRLREICQREQRWLVDLVSPTRLN